MRGPINRQGEISGSATDSKPFTSLVAKLSDLSGRKVRTRGALLFPFPLPPTSTHLPDWTWTPSIRETTYARFLQGQTSGRTDHLVIGHAAQDLELLVFYRNRKYEFPGAGFRYLGVFEYVSHQKASPTSFVLHKVLADDQIISAEQADSEPFDPDSIEDARERIARTVAQRRGQQAFRDALLGAYGARCAISGCAVKDVLEAAHITPYRGDATNAISNGLLLRSDLHTLFDCGLVTIDPETMQVVTSIELACSGYAKLDGRPLRVPSDPAKAPSKKALKQHLEQSKTSRAL